MAGIGVGALNYWGLWLTVQKLAVVRHPALLNIVSLVTRMGMTIFVFYVAMGGGWERLVICLLGFLLVRSMIVRRIMPRNNVPPSPAIKA